MDKIITYFSKNRLVVNLIIILIIGVGIIAASRIHQEVMPATDMNTIMVTVSYPGASPQDVELNVIVPIENELKTIVGIKETMSLSMENMGRVYIYIDEDNPDTKSIKDDIIRTVQNISGLPPEIEDVAIKDINPKLMSVYSVGLEMKKDSGLTQKDLMRWTDKIEKGLQKVQGVAEVKTEGYLEPEIRIQVDPRKMQKYYISLNDIALSIQKRNVRSTGGTLQSVSEEKNIVTLGQFENPLDVKDVIIRSSFEQKRVIINDIASVRSGYKKENIQVHINQNPAIIISVVKKENEDITRTIDFTKEYLEKIKKQLPEGLTITTIDDRSRSVKALLDVVKSNSLMGFVLVFVILFLFLDIKSAFWTAVGIPLTVLMIITYMYLDGISLNIISLGAIITVLGMLVDHGIVISENIFHYKNEGFSPVDAAIRGLKEVMGPIIITILTTIVAFLPLLAVGGKMGKFISVYPVIVAVALGASFFEAMFLLPNHLTHGKIKEKKKKKHWFTPFSEWYKKVLKSSLNIRYVILAAFVIIFGITMILAKQSFKKFILFPSNTADTIYINVEAPEGTSLEKTTHYLKKVEKLVLSSVQSNDLVALKTISGHHRVKSYNDMGFRENWGQVMVYLVPSTERKDSAGDLIKKMRKKITEKPIDEFEKILFGKLVMGPDPGQGLDIKLTAENPDNLKTALTNVIEHIHTLQGVVEVDHSLKPGKKELKVDFKYNKLAQLDMDVATVAQAIRMAYEGQVVTSIQTLNHKLDYRVTIAPGFQRDKQFLLDLLIPNKQGRLIPLKKVASVKEQEGMSTIIHYNNQRTVIITANVNKKITTSKQVARNIKMKFKDISQHYPGVSLLIGGEAKETQDSISDLVTAFLLAILGIYIILALLFNHPTQPLLVLIVIPFGMTGALLAFMAHGVPLSFMGMVGLIGLSGVVVNDSVVMVSFINTMIKQNPSLKKEDLKESIAEGAKRRLRPVILTTLTTVGGLIPTVYGIGGSSESIVPVVMALSYGLLFATFLTLFFIPSMYLIAFDIKKLPDFMRQLALKFKWKKN